MADKFKQVETELVGVVPLLMHNGRLADSGYSWTKLIKELTDKPLKQRSPEDELIKRELEWNGGLYFDDEIGPYIPAEVIEGTVRNGAKKVKSALSTLVTTGLGVVEDRVPLQYEGPRNRDELYGDDRFVDSRIVKLKGSSSIVRTRPKFPAGWVLHFTFSMATEVITPTQVRQALEKAGMMVGMGDYRPRFGRFTVRRFEEIK